MGTETLRARQTRILPSLGRESERRVLVGKYRCIFVDWHNTLSQSLFWDHLEAGGSVSRQLCARLRSSLFGRRRELLNPWMRGTLSTEAVMEIIAEDTGLPSDLILTEFIAGCQQMAFDSPDIPALVGTLRADGCRVVIATDNMDCFLRWTVPSLGLTDIFDDILCSAEIGGLKRDLDGGGQSVFFRKALSEFRLRPGESVLLDDDASVAESIRSFGIDFLQITTEQKLAPALQQLLAEGAASHTTGNNPGDR